MARRTASARGTTARWTLDLAGSTHVVELWRPGAGKGNERTFWCDGVEYGLGGVLHRGPRVTPFEVGGEPATLTMRMVPLRFGAAMGRSYRAQAQGGRGFLLRILVANLLGGPGAGAGVAAASATNATLSWNVYSLRVGPTDHGSWVSRNEGATLVRWTYVEPGGVVPDGRSEGWPLPTV